MLVLESKVDNVTCAILATAAITDKNQLTKVLEKTEIDLKINQCRSFIY
jgi:hypothetical protein